MRLFRVVSVSLMIGLSLAACRQQTKVKPPRGDEEPTSPAGKSSNAALAGLSLSAGALTPAFAQDTTAYKIDVAYPTSTTTVTATVADDSASVALNGVALSSATASAALPLPVGSTKFALVVTAEDGTTSRTYTVTVNRPEQPAVNRPEQPTVNPPELSADATLSDLRISEGTLIPGVNAAADYAFKVTSAVNSTTVTATATDSKASLQIQGSAATFGGASQDIVLGEGNTDIKVVVTAQNGTKKTYAVTITKLAKDSDATLSELVPSIGTLSPAFSPFVEEYTLEVPDEVLSMTLTPKVTRWGEASIVNYYSSFTFSVSSGKSVAVVFRQGTLTPKTDETVKLAITAKDGTQMNYVVHVRRLPKRDEVDAGTSIPGTELKGLIIEGVTLAPAFAAGTTSYAATVTYATDRINVTATTANSSSSLQIAGAAANSGEQRSVLLNHGTNIIPVVVTDGATPAKVYKLAVTRSLSVSSAVSAMVLTVNGTEVALSPLFDGGSKGPYALNIPEEFAGYGVQIKLTMTSQDATYYVKFGPQGVTTNPMVSLIGDSHTMTLGANDLRMEIYISAQSQHYGSGRGYTINVNR